MTVKKTKNIFLNETSLTEILLSLLFDDAEYSENIREIVNKALETGDTENE